MKNVVVGRIFSFMRLCYGKIKNCLLVRREDIKMEVLCIIIALLVMTAVWGK